MRRMNGWIVGVALVVTVLSGWRVAPAAEPTVLPIWGEDERKTTLGEEQTRNLTEGKVDRFVSNVTWPTLTAYLPPADKANGAAVIICPGGAYVGVAVDREGHAVAQWLNSIGVAGFVLKYRMPRVDLTGDAKPWPLQDAQRAIRLVRSRAKQWRLKTDRIGIMGFSAGGHLASTAGTHFDSGRPEAADPMDRLSCRPDFLILVYPVITFKGPNAHVGSRDALLGKAADLKRIEQYCNELQVTPQTPPTFLVHAKDDEVKVENSILFYEALKKANVPAHLQLYENGGHGFGLGMNGGEVATWPQRCGKWLEEVLKGRTAD